MIGALRDKRCSNKVFAEENKQKVPYAGTICVCSLVEVSEDLDRVHTKYSES